VKRREFEYLNLARFVGAFWVLLFHANIHFGSLDSLSLINPILNQGVLGMTLFFVLSGFVLSHRYSSFELQGSVRDFYAARVVRLYPVYIFMALITLPTLVTSGESFVLYEKVPIIWLISMVIIGFLAVQAWAPALFSAWNFGGSWSLSVEAFFYSLFPVLRPKIGSLSNQAVLLTVFASLGVMAVIVVLMFLQLGERSQSSIFYVLPIFRIPEFILGISIFVLCVERQLHLRPLYIASIASFAVLIALIYWRNLPGLIEYGFLVCITRSYGVCVFTTGASLRRRIKDF
jgi:peptidoglycan/LPS O-acetylase OafA/YrhL